MTVGDVVGDLLSLTTSIDTESKMNSKMLIGSYLTNIDSFIGNLVPGDSMNQSQGSIGYSIMKTQNSDPNTMLNGQMANLSIDS